MYMPGNVGRARVSIRLRDNINTWDYESDVDVETGTGKLDLPEHWKAPTFDPPSYLIGEIKIIPLDVHPGANNEVFYFKVIQVQECF